MKRVVAFFFTLCFVVLFVGCGERVIIVEVDRAPSVDVPVVAVPAAPVNAFNFTPVEQAELDRVIREHGTGAIVHYVRDIRPSANSNRTLEGVKYLITQGACIQRGLAGAAQTRHVNIAEFLIAQGASVNPISGAETPLHLAASRGHLEMVKFLVAKGANVNAISSSGKTPLDDARFFNSTGRNTHVIEYLSGLQR